MTSGESSIGPISATATGSPPVAAIWVRVCWTRFSRSFMEVPAGNAAETTSTPWTLNPGSNRMA